jgi:hypothetical protein
MRKSIGMVCKSRVKTQGSRLIRRQRGAVRHNTHVDPLRGEKRRRSTEINQERETMYGVEE